jgi:EpsI family protein
MPLELEDYTSQNIYLSRETTQYGSADDWILREYKAKHNDLPMLVFAGYWANQDEQKTIKSPRYMEGAQYSVKDKTITSRENEIFTVNSFVHDNNQQKELVYYCFLMDGKVIPDDYHFRLLRMISKLLYGKNNAALLRVSTPITPDFPVEMAEPYIEDFLKDFLPIVKEYLPR